MAKKLDQLLVIDIESTCWTGPPPSGMISDIIEIGICPIDLASLTRLERRSIFVKPERSEVSDFCTELTTISPAMLQGAMTFREACSILKKEYLSAQRTWASYGDYDRNQFQRQCTDTGVPYPFGPTHWNIKSLLAVFLGLPTEVGTLDSLAHLGVVFEGTNHRAHDDAWNVAELLIHLLKPYRGGI
ncbi:MAG: exonuclease domain-containing protein [Fimbriiglobus sp.]